MSNESNKQTQQINQNNTVQKKKNIKTTIRNLLVLVLVAAISIVGTLAFLNKQTDKKVNTFTGSAGINLTLTEPNWDSTGKTMAENYTPKMEIPKDPTLTNISTTTDSDEWVALRVDYTYYDGAQNVATTRDDLETNLIETLDIDTSKWIKLITKGTSGGADTMYDIYLYKNKLPQTSSSNSITLFDKVKIKKQEDLAGKTLGGSPGTAVCDANGKYINFNITLFGAAIKHDASISSTLTELDNAATIGEIDMDNLTAAASASDSRKIALALVALLKDLP